jgi:hypothetical protein
MAKRKAKLGKEFSNWFDAAGNLKPDIQKKTSAPVTAHPDEQVPARLAAVLMFPKSEVRIEEVEQAGSVRGPDESKARLYEMPKTARPTEHQPLRILPAQAAVKRLFFGGLCR